LPPDWDELAPLVDAILDAPREARAALLAELGGTDPGRRSAVVQLVAECEREAPLLEKGAFERFDQLLDDPEFRLPDILSGRYQMVRELGRGGMACVYLARDLKHQRDVAIKVVRPELAASLGREQFLREIAIAARLRHPNIVPLYDSGDDAGALYFVMPFEAGPSLREKLGLGPLATADAVSVLRDVARALAYAHEQGIVHRDVKPDNVMLSSGAAVVADFGIARAFHVAQTQTPAVSMALTGVFGTPAYMAPEQAAGDSGSDHRADIYSFGCTAYELFVGRPPFGGDSAEEIITAHFVALPRPVSELRADIPPTVAEVISRCLEKNPDARPQSATELVAALDTVAASAGTSARLSRRLRALVAISMILIPILAVAGYVVASRRERAVSSAAGPATIAVLPFKSVGGDSTHALFTEGLADEIASALVKVPWVRIMSRRGVSNYRGQRDIDYRRAGRDLGARYLLTGSAREVGGHEIVMLRLISAADGSALWAERFDRPSAELEVQRNEMVHSIAQAARPLAGSALTARGPDVPAERRTSGEAYFYQVQAQQWLDRRGLSVRSSAEYFRRAISVDPNYARAYSGLSLALALYPYFQNIPPADVQNELTSSARRALQLDSTLAQPHIALGLAHEHNLQWDSAGAEFTSAIGLDNHDVEARVQYGRYLLFRGRTQEALAQFQAAREADPASALVLSWVSYTYYLERQQDSARVISERALKSNARNFTALLFRSLILLADGRLDGARQLVAGMPSDANSAIYVMAVTGKPEATRLEVEALLKRRPTPWMVHTAHAYAMMGLGDTAQALGELELATQHREIWPALIPQSDRIFDGIRESARFRKLIEQVGLADTSKRAVLSRGAR
jgi:TolB-like protein/tetratricopeptide (TPR) repeat protein/tRNA A-37 threonylcarbamoyl transferase component Bud32